MSDGHRSGRSTGRVSCKSTELKRCSMIEMRWNKYEILLFLLLFLLNKHAACAVHGPTKSPIL